ncbi:MAG: hypothetical protein IKJ74_02050 [Clostridia bacterium]|nr:hypothetical protein [Clostridia bacterium]
MEQIPQKRSLNYRGMSTDRNIEVEDITFHDPRKAPFRLYGLEPCGEGEAFRRMPWRVANEVSWKVYSLHSHTAGGRVRFRTDSDRVVIDVSYDLLEPRACMSLLCSVGFDLYVEEDGKDVYYNDFLPPLDCEKGYRAQISFSQRKMRTVTIYFPLYNDVKDLKIGLLKDAALEEAPGYGDRLPLLFYGSSITQGASVARPGLGYPARIARELRMDFRNLGFAGSCKGEPRMAEYLATQKSSAFILDYDHNSKDPEELAATHYNVYRTYRDQNPETPIILVTRPACRPLGKAVQGRRRVVMETYLRAVSEGDQNVWFVDGTSFLSMDDRFDGTVDGTHPNDLGQHRMAAIIGEVIASVLRR